MTFRDQAIAVLRAVGFRSYIAVPLANALVGLGACIAMGASDRALMLAGSAEQWETIASTPFDADAPELLRAIDATGAEHIQVTHGFRGPLVHWLQDHGRDAVAARRMIGGRLASASRPASTFWALAIARRWATAKRTTRG